MKSKTRCAWCGEDPLYQLYHDTEWGLPVWDDHKMFEFLVLESFQAGLSWITVLRKRENFRKAFDNMNVEKMARYDQKKIDSLMQDSGIIRNKAKIEASISNAQLVAEMLSAGEGLCDYLWGFQDGKVQNNKFESLSELPAKTALSEKISKDMKKRGFKFLGPTTIYAHMQASGMVNDHFTSCFRYPELIKL